MHTLSNLARSNCNRAGTAQRRGVMLPLIVLLLPVLVVFLGFAVDVAYMQTTRLELRAATDAAARAAANKLSSTGSQAEARAEAIRVAGANTVGGRRLSITTGDIEIGRSIRTSNGRFVFTAGAAPANAVRVTGGNGAATPLIFGRVIGVNDFSPISNATASFLNVDICLVLDRSTSMKVDVNSNEKGLSTADGRFCRAPNASSRWVALDSAVKVFTETLRASGASEQVAVATYSSSFSPVIFCGTSPNASSLDIALTTSLDAVDSRIDSLTSTVWNGNTDIESGMRTGLAELVNGVGAREAADRYLIVLTDGNENEGSAEDAAAAADAAGVTVHTITFSIDANQALMQNVASRANGRHFHANTPEELRDVFRELAAATAQITD